MASSVKKPWGGRFREDTDRLVEEFTESVSFDQRLALHDLRQDLAHLEALKRAGVVTEEEAERIARGLSEIEAEIREGRFVFRAELEDVHMNIEAALREKIGPLAGKLHTGRSRNDQVATDFRLYLRDEIREILRLLHDLRRALVEKAREGLEIILPGFTHLQHAQPVLLAHHLLAYYEMFRRDADRFQDTLRRTAECPLGSAALAGTPYPLDRELTARLLGFERPSRNSMDAVSDRDFVLEFLFDAAVTMMHLSRLAEEIVLWMSPEFGFVDLPDALCTGSSIMPQKKNPDVAELLRGKCGRVYGNLLALLTVMKGLPLTYNRDLQEDKEPAFDTADTLRASLKVAALLVRGLSPRAERMRAAAEEGHPTATDLADYLVMKGLPFREAHEVTGRIVAFAEERGLKLWKIPLEDLRRFSDLIEEDVYEWLSVEGSVARRRTYGGTAPERVREALAQAEEELSAEELP
ncbi:argininosuccinate lyase [Thermosulfurimonas marina]|uniref:Argininosuccinate lyase n=1 Tax=Thermosulfurimonas marina TaxID=2047767 RepID=A0A6H1WT65_9BACT|nr:argininosuccinate lyase [Thermosulfurimonas marina]QJA06316.1 argininosuccinate lyase [Thermosulfurimonas marina]